MFKSHYPERGRKPGGRAESVEFAFGSNLITPKGDGNASIVGLEVDNDTSSNLITPKGDGNSRSTMTPAAAPAVQISLPRKGTETRSSRTDGVPLGSSNLITPKGDGNGSDPDSIAACTEVQISLPRKGTETRDCNVKDSLESRVQISLPRKGTETAPTRITLRYKSGSNLITPKGDGNPCESGPHTSSKSSNLITPKGDGNSRSGRRPERT